MLEKKEYTQFGETIYSEELDNGLKVKLLPKKSFHKVYGIMSTNYGSADNEFVPYGKRYQLSTVYGVFLMNFKEAGLEEKFRTDTVVSDKDSGAVVNPHFRQIYLQFP